MSEITVNLAALKQKVKVAVLATGAFVVSATAAIPPTYEHYKAQTSELVELAAEEALEKAKATQRALDNLQTKASEKAKAVGRKIDHAAKTASTKIKKVMKPVDALGAKIGTPPVPKPKPPTYETSPIGALN